MQQPAQPQLVFLRGLGPGHCPYPVMWHLGTGFNSEHEGVQGRATRVVKGLEDLGTWELGHLGCAQVCDPKTIQRTSLSTAPKGAIRTTGGPYRTQTPAQEPGPNEDGMFRRRLTATFQAGEGIPTLGPGYRHLPSRSHSLRARLAPWKLSGSSRLRGKVSVVETLSGTSSLWLLIWEATFPEVTLLGTSQGTPALTALDGERVRCEKNKAAFKKPKPKPTEHTKAFCLLTALFLTREPENWRVRKRDGGIASSLVDSPLGLPCLGHMTPCYRITSLSCNHVFNVWRSGTPPSSFWCPESYKSGWFINNSANACWMRPSAVERQTFSGTARLQWLFLHLSKAQIHYKKKKKRHWITQISFLYDIKRPGDLFTPRWVFHFTLQHLSPVFLISPREKRKWVQPGGWAASCLCPGAMTSADTLRDWVCLKLWWAGGLCSQPGGSVWNSLPVAWIPGTTHWGWRSSGDWGLCY